MALLTQSKTTGAKTTGTRSRWLLLLFGCAGGCALINVLSPSTPTFGFSHAVHAEEGLECDNCHIYWETSDSPGIPTKGACDLCHEDIDAEKPPERQIAALFDGDVFKALGASKLSEEVKFSHLRHAAGIECGACHTGMETNTRVDASVALTMTACRDCHQQRSIADDCRTCHEHLDRDVAPESHEFLWTRRHGATFRAHNPTTADDCSLCHDDSTCKSCHATTRPENHDNFFRHRGHGLHARMDRNSCATCHRSDSCDACHQDARPHSHTGSFSGALNTHCLGCHLPVQNSECFTCHKSTPSHATATPKPADHSAGMNCRQCHGISQPMPHVDKGDDCNSCHH